MPSHDVLTAAQQRAIPALLGNKTVEQAAQQAGVSTRSLYRWLAEPVFAAALRSAEGELLAAAVRSLAGLQAEAIATLHSALSAPKVADKIKAATALLNYGVQLRQTYVLEQRLAALEQLLLGGKDDASI